MNNKTGYNRNSYNGNGNGYNHDKTNSVDDKDNSINNINSTFVKGGGYNHSRGGGVGGGVGGGAGAGYNHSRGGSGYNHGRGGSGYNHNNGRNNGNGGYNQSRTEINDDNNDSYIDTSKHISNNIKTALLDFLYNKIEVNDHKYVIIKNISDIYELKNNKHYMSANTCGINSLIIFIKKDNNYYSYLVDRRSISYNRQSLNISKVRFVEIKLPVDIKLYDGTILDGILIDNNNIGNDDSVNNMDFMITDVFLLNGKSLITMDYKKKMYMVNESLKEFISNYKPNVDDKSKNKNINLHVSRPYEINQFSSMFNEYISHNSNKYNIKGISFYPNTSGTKLIYIFDKQDEKIKNDLCNNTHNYIDDDNKVGEANGTDTKGDGDINSNLKIVYKYDIINIENTCNIECNLEMHKTNLPDVYKLFGIFFINNVYIKRRIGIAYIPTYKLSLKCKSYFMNKNILIFTCKLDINKNKWIPIDEATVQKIDIINKNSHFKIIEEIYDADGADDDNVDGVEGTFGTC